MPAFLLTEVAPASVYGPHLSAGTLWVVDVDGVLVAFLAACVEGSRLHIDELDVRQDQQGQGLGRRLLAEAEAWARARGLQRLSLTTFRAIPWNAPFYARVGFREWTDPPATLAQRLRQEAARGLPDRCAMVLDL